MKHLWTLVFAASVLATTPTQGKDGGSFQPLTDRWPTPNERRLATGQPGPDYWQQHANYDIKVELDTASKRLYGSAAIHYFNESPHELHVIWVQLDQNRFRPDSRGNRSRTLSAPVDTLTFRDWLRLLKTPEFEGGVRITRTTVGGREVTPTVVDTAMRLVLPEPLKPGASVRLSVDWWHPLVDLNRLGGRSGYETLTNDQDIFVLAQWYPRVAAYTDYGGWQHKSFLGAAEFTLEFGNFQVAITLPSDYLVAATGELQNMTTVLNTEQRKRYIRGQRASQPVMVVTAEEVRKALRKPPARGKKTWIYHAEGVRDFAFSASRAFLWDTMGLNLNGNWITIMSFYPEEVAPLWSKYVSESAALALKVYSKHTFDYPYPVSVQVNGPVFGMEYPMLTFMGSRPYPDGSYWGGAPSGVAESSKYSKYALISTTIHEVGHNFFPMIVNSDERKWTWMDEGLNTFLQFLTEQEWSEDYPSRRGWVDEMAAAMRDKKLRPIMSDGDTLLNRGITGYGKPAAALNLLRELVLGRELFDEAFREYANRWKFRRPTPVDFFRSMEDVSGTNLDWFWRTWFYRTDYVDVAVNSVRRIHLSDPDPDVRKARLDREQAKQPPRLTDERNQSIDKLVDRQPELKDFYDDFDNKAPTAKDRSDYQKLLKQLTPFEKEILQPSDRLIYLLDLENKGGAVTPVPLRLHLANGETEDLLLPAEVWRYREKRIQYLLVRQEELLAVEFDPQRATGDANTGNNRFPPKLEEIPVLPVKATVPDNPLRQSRKSR